MIFNSIDFCVFFLFLYLLYWVVFNKYLKSQNFILLVASYFFYGWTDWHFLPYILIVSAFNFFLGLYIGRLGDGKLKRVLVYTGLLQAIGGLVYFKYFNFIIRSAEPFLRSLHINTLIDHTSILVPIGISFFTFRTLSYTLDVNTGKIKPVKDWVSFFTYVAFFPSLLSGPIDKARTFIPQLKKRRFFNYEQSVDGLRQVLWGLFKKVIIADKCNTIADQLFANSTNLPASSLMVGAFMYTIQIYADFSGYSDMAIGIAKTLGFTVSPNFNYPFFAQNIADFWRKWHISLTSWLTEYLFTPLSITFRDYHNAGLMLAILINFTIIGIWHGPNWTYVLFGFLHGVYYIPLIIKGTVNKQKKISKDRVLPTFNELMNMVKTFLLVMLTFILFRSESISQAGRYYLHLLSLSLFSMPVLLNKVHALKVVVLISVMIIIEWLGRNNQHALQSFGFRWPKAVRLTFYYLLIFYIGYISINNGSNSFIYFKF